MRRNTKSWVEELKGASLGASAHAHQSHWCALMGAGRFVCVASVPAPNSPDWVHVMTKALGKETKKQGITIACLKCQPGEFEFGVSPLKAVVYFKTSWRVTGLITFHRAVENHWLPWPPINLWLSFGSKFEF